MSFRRVCPQSESFRGNCLESRTELKGGYDESDVD
jgi:hypothetical protein